MYTVLVCGGRDYDNATKVVETLLMLCDKKGLWENGEHSHHCESKATGLRLITGEARGADTLARMWAHSGWGPQYQGYPANWKRDGMRAGPIRNQLMLDSEKVDLVIAFPGGSGTRDMVSRAQKAGIEVKIIK